MTWNEYHAGGSTRKEFNFSVDDKYLVSSNSGDNSVIIYSAEEETCKLPKDYAFLLAENIQSTYVVSR